MKVLVATAVASLLSIVSAQTSLSNLPHCAQSCVGNGLTATGCNILDIKCICSSSKFIAEISCCIKTACSAADQATTITFATQLCSSAGITVPNNAASACAEISPPVSTSTAAPSTEAASSPATSSEGSSSTVSSSAGSSSLGSSSSGSSSFSPASNLTVTSATLTATGHPTATTKASTSTSATANAGSQFLASGMGLAGAAFAALALL